MKASELVKALEEGKLLAYIHDYGQITHVFLLLYEGQTILEVRGWQSTQRDHDSYIRMLVTCPECWYIVTDTKQFRWYDEQYQIASFRGRKITNIVDEL
jgi:hypothetical protein